MLHQNGSNERSSDRRSQNNHEIHNKAHYEKNKMYIQNKRFLKLSSQAGTRGENALSSAGGLSSEPNTSSYDKRSQRFAIDRRKRLSSNKKQNDDIIDMVYTSENEKST